MAGPNEVSSTPPAPSAVPTVIHFALLWVLAGHNRHRLTADSSESAARKVYTLLYLLPSGMVLIVASKTFLARLCEQAERYDGKSLRSNTCASLLC